MAFQYESKPSKMAQMVMKYSGGIVKTEDQANRVLLWFAIVLFAGVALSFFVGGSKPKPVAPPGYHFVYPPNAPYYLEKDSDLTP